MANLKPLLLPHFSIYITVKSISLITCFWLSISSYSLAQEVEQDFEPATITVTFTKGATFEDIDDTMGKMEPHLGASGSPLKGEFDFEILVPHYSQRIYDDAELLDYEATIAVTLNTGWKLISGLPNEPLKYKLPKMTDKDTIQAPLKESDLAVLIFEEIITESNSNSNHTNEPPKVVCVHINFQTPTILLSIHKPDKFKEDKDLAYRPEAERDDTNETFGTAYAGIMLRNEDNDDADPLPDPIDSAPLPRDNDDDKASADDDDLVGLKIQTLQPYDFAFKDELMLKLKFDHNDSQIRVFDGKSKAGATKVSIDTLKAGVPLNKEASSDEHLYTAVKKEEETLYIEGLGSSVSPEDERYGDKPLKVTLCIEPDTTNKKYSESIGLFVHLDAVPDWDRDGMISDEDAGKASVENPFIFWINDDNDEYSVEEIADIPQSGNDGEDMIINGKRDLVDFFPVQLRLKSMLELFPSDKYTYKISHPEGALNFIEMPMVQPDSQRINGAGAYLVDEMIAAEALNREMKDTAGDGSELSKEYLDALNEGMGVLIFEAKKASNQSFELIVSKNGGGNEMKLARALPIELEDVESMYWRVNIRPVVYDQKISDTIPPAFEKFKKTRKNRWYVFCHGYNVSENRARGWNAEVFKRLHQMGSDSKFLSVTWEGNQGQINEQIPLFGGITPDFWHNSYNAFRSSSALSTVVNRETGGGKVIAGHSLANILVSSAICDHGLKSEQFFMLNGAVGREAYSAAHVSQDRSLVRHPKWKNLATYLWSTDYWRLFPANDGRSKLTWQGRFSTLAAKTKPHNYYSSTEDVLQSGDGNVPKLIRNVTIRSELAWVKQEMSKGLFTKKLTAGVRESNGGWGFNKFWKSNPPAPAQKQLLISNPYFKPFTQFSSKNGNKESIHGNKGSALAKDYAIRSFLLGHDIPALSNPIGSNEINGFSIDPKNTNTDMSSDLRSGNWGRWQHSDIKNEPMERVWKLYSDMVSKGKLNR